MFTALLLVALTQAPPPEPPPEPVSSPPLVSAEPATQESSSAARTFEVRFLATGTAVTTPLATTLGFGAHGELDLFRVALTATYDRGITSTFGLSDVQSLTILAGYSVVAHKHVRVRVLGGVATRWSDTSAVGPSFGITTRAGFHFISVDAAATFTPAPFRRFDGRAALALHGLLFELQGGIRARVLDTTDGGSLSSFFATASEVGPYVAVGLSL